MVTTKRPSQREQHNAKIKAAMPGVEAVVKEHGLRIVSGCVAKLQERQRLRKKAEGLRQQIQQIEAQI